MFLASCVFFFFFFKQKTAYEMRISDWSSDVCSSDLDEGGRLAVGGDRASASTPGYYMQPTVVADTAPDMRINNEEVFGPVVSTIRVKDYEEALAVANRGDFGLSAGIVSNSARHIRDFRKRSEEHTSELQSLMRISYALFCLKQKKRTHNPHHT